MKQRTIIWLTILALALPCRHGFGQNASAFTYQGQLAASSAPANGYFDLRFTLYATNNGGSAVAGPIAKPPMLVSNGLFTTGLDFGAAVFDGSARWLEIAVRPSGSSGAYTILAPRQRITVTPYALQSGTVANGAITAAKLSPGAGADGQVLKMSGGSLAWGSSAAGSGTVTSIATGTGLVGGPITTSGTLAIDTSVVPRLGAANTFSGANQFANSANSFVGTFAGNGGGLTNLNVAGSTNLDGANITNLNASNISSGTLADARLSTNAALLNRLQTFTGTNTFAGPATLTNVGNAFAGSGAGLIGLNAANVTAGTLADGRLSANVALLAANQIFTGSNTFNGVSALANNANRFVGAFFGNGAGLTNLSGAASTNYNGANITNLNASNISSGTLADARLSTNVALLNRAQTFTGANTFGGVTTLTNVGNVLAGSGAGLTGLSAANLTAGTLADARLSANVALLAANQTFTGSNTFNGVSALANNANRFVGAFFGDGAGLTNLSVAASTNYNGSNITNLNASNISSGTLADARLSTNVALLSRAQTFTGANTFGGVTTLTNIGNVLAGSGAGLTGLSAANLTAGTLADARLSANVALLAANQTFTGSNTFNGVSALANNANRFVGAFFGNGAGLTNLTSTATNAAVTLSGDVTGANTNTTVARIRGANVSPSAPAANQHLRYDGANWTPAAVALGTDVSGTLAVASGGTAATTPAGARANLGAAASGANADITSLGGLTTPLSAVQGGSGQSSYTIGDLLYAGSSTALSKLPDVAAGNALLSGGVGGAPAWGKIGLTSHVTGTLPLANGGTGLGAYSAGDLLYAPSANTLARRAVGSSGQVLTVSGGLPTWAAISAHDHLGQSWIGNAVDGLYVENTTNANNVSGLTGVASGTGANFGVFGQSDSVNGAGVEGFASSGSGFTTGVTGETASPQGSGVYGLASSLNGTNAGVYGETSAPYGSGVFGIATSTNGVPVGVFGSVSAANGYGLYTPDRLFVGHNAFVNGNLGIGTGSKIQADVGTSNAPSITFLGNNGAGVFSPGTNILAFATSGTERLRIGTNGNVGVGRTAATNKFEVEGEASKATAGGWLANSDARIKTDIRDLSHALDTIERVRPVEFRYTVEYRQAHPGIEDKPYYNVVAQEFAEVFPTAVKPSGELLEGQPILQVDTYPAAIYSIAAIRELHGQVQARDKELTRLAEQNARLEARLAAVEKLLSTIAPAGAR